MGGGKLRLIYTRVNTLIFSCNWFQIVFVRSHVVLPCLTGAQGFQIALDFPFDTVCSFIPSAVLFWFFLSSLPGCSSAATAGAGENDLYEKKVLNVKQLHIKLILIYFSLEKL